MTSLDARAGVAGNKKADHSGLARQRSRFQARRRAFFMAQPAGQPTRIAALENGCASAPQRKPQPVSVAICR
ncbi:MAG: hypothetical protein U0V87_04965 [Acidobacteriota bacterium]